LGERLLCKQEVIGSNPFTSTTGERRLARAGAAAFGEARRHGPGAVGAWGGVLIEG
jgi:hypothetical protein